MATVTVTKDNFEEAVIRSDRPVLIDFWAAWCNPCRMLGPILEELAEETQAIKCCKINIDDEPELAAKFGVMNIPALFAIRDGQVINSTVGVQPKEALKALFD